MSDREKNSKSCVKLISILLCRLNCSSDVNINLLFQMLKSGRHGDNGPSALPSVEPACKCVNVIVKPVATSAKLKTGSISDPVIHRLVQPPFGRSGINGVIAG